MIFAIRDDDTCAFTRPEEIETLYRDIWDVCPVSLSVTPFRIPGSPRRKNAVPPEYYGNTTELPLESNPELVSFLREKNSAGEVSITLHGYNHAVYREGPEYVAGRDLTSKTSKAKNYLESVLGVQITTFVPPNNTIGPRGLQAVISNNLNLVGVPSFRFRFCIPNISKVVKIWYYQTLHGFPYPFVLDFQDHKEVIYFSLVPVAKLSRLLRGLKFVHERDGVFILSTHYHEMNEPMKYDDLNMKEAFWRIWEKAQELSNVNFCSVDDIFKA